MTINANSPPCEDPLNLEKMSLYNPLCVDGTTRQRCGANVPPVPLDGKYLWQTTQRTRCDASAGLAMCNW